jgi:hypothetical protein
MTARHLPPVVAAALSLDAVVSASTALDALWPGRTVATLAFFVCVPGLAVAVWLGSSSLAELVTVAVAASIAADVLVVQAMLLAHAWHPGAAQLILGAAAAPLLILWPPASSPPPQPAAPATGDDGRDR